MKKNYNLFIIVLILLIMGIGVSFAFYTASVSQSGSGSSGTGRTHNLIKVTYDAGSSTLSSSNLTPGNTISKTFKVTTTPGSNATSTKYAIKLNISSNTFVKCTDSNYNSVSNACTKNAEELTYTLKDASGTAISTGDLTGKTGTVVLATETKSVLSTVTHNYTLEITYKNTNADQNHNMNKTISGNVKVEFTS